VSDGRIAAVSAWDALPPGAQVRDAGSAVIFPGLVDIHVHVNEPGRTEWEGFLSATRAAAAGGVTTLLDMPLNSIPPTTTVAAVALKRGAALGRCAVDVGFLGGVVPGNLRELTGLHDAGVFGFKCFLCPSGVEEFPPVTEADLRAALPVLAGLDAVLMVHAEAPERLVAATGDPRRYATWLASRPASAETGAVELLVRLAREHGLQVHVVHVSSPDTARLIENARTAGVRITGETCPHYLAFAAEEIPDGATEYKCAPPVRDAACREGLWAALASGQLAAVVSDHSPSPPDLKRRETGSFHQAWGGIASLQLRLPAVWTGARSRGYGLDRLVEWLCTGPARIAGLGRQKGALTQGLDADLVIWHPEEEFTVQAAGLRHRHPLSPWLGRRLAGRIEATYLRGEPVFREDAPDAPPRGQLLERPGP
jgi:allantoinase